MSGEEGGADRDTAEAKDEKADEQGHWKRDAKGKRVWVTEWEGSGEAHQGRVGQEGDDGEADKAQGNGEGGQLVEDGEEKEEEEVEDDEIVLVASGGAVPSSKLLRQALGEEDYMTLVILALRALTSLRRYSDAGALISEALVSGRFPLVEHVNLLRMWAVLVSLRSGMNMAAYDSVRYACKLRPHSFAVWNLFNRVINSSGVILKRLSLESV